VDDKQAYGLQKVQVLGANIFPIEDIEVEQNFKKLELGQLRVTVLFADILQHHDERILGLPIRLDITDIKRH
jgi:hypothetical protein